MVYAQITNLTKFFAEKRFFSRAKPGHSLDLVLIVDFVEDSLFNYTDSISRPFCQHRSWIKSTLVQQRNCHRWIHSGTINGSHIPHTAMWVPVLQYLQMNGFQILPSQISRNLTNAHTGTCITSDCNEPKFRGATVVKFGRCPRQVPHLSFFFWGAGWRLSSIRRTLDSH